MKAAKGKNVFITGSTGFLGAKFVRVLLASDPEVKAWLLVRGKNGMPYDRRINSFGREIRDRVGLVEGDVTVPGLGMSASRWKGLARVVDEVVHLAGSTELDGRKASQVKRVNVNGTAHVTEFASKCAALRAFNHVSSAYVAGRTRYPAEVFETPNRLEGSGENPYEQSKWDAERIVLGSGLPFRVWRPTICVGDLNTGESDRKVVYGFASGLARVRDGMLRSGLDLRRHTVHILGAPDARKDMIGVNIVADTMVAAREFPDGLQEIFHLSNPDAATVLDLKIAMAEHLGLGNVRLVPNYERHPDTTPYEWKLYKTVSSLYGPYMLKSDPVFDRTHTDAMLEAVGRPDLKPEPMTRETLRFLIGKFYAG